MADSRFVIRIVRADGSTVDLRPGGQAEKDFIEDVIIRTHAKGVGWGRTTAHVLTDMRSALMESLFDLKSDIAPVE
jgi:hypothetical protein